MHKKRINDVEEGVFAVVAGGRLMHETQKRDADFSASLFCVYLIPIQQGIGYQAE